MRTFLGELVVLPYDQHVACCLVRELPLATFSIKDYADFAEHEGLEVVH